MALTPSDRKPVDMKARAHQVGRALARQAEDRHRRRVAIFRAAFEAKGHRWPWTDDADVELVERPPSIGAALAAQQKGRPKPATYLVARERK